MWLVEGGGQQSPWVLRIQANKGLLVHAQKSIGFLHASEMIAAHLKLLLSFMSAYKIWNGLKNLICEHLKSFVITCTVGKVEAPPKANIMLAKAFRI